MLILSTSSLQWYWLHRIFQFTKKAWYLWVDLALNKLNYDSWDENYIKNLSDEFWVPVVSITAPVRWMDEKKVDKIIKIAQTLKTQLVTFSPPHYSDKKTSWFTSYLKRIMKTSVMW